MSGRYGLRPGPLSAVPLATLMVLAFAAGLLSLRYLSGDPAALPPSMQASFVANGRIFVVHTTASALALMIGAAQFWALPRRRWPGVHRWAGRTYVLFCAMGAASALWIAPDVESGWVATLGFSALAVAWMAVTAQAWRHAMHRRFDLHRRWMLRSYALTAAAISLRLQLLAFEAFGLDYDQVSALLSLSCWLPNVALIEMALYWTQRRRAVSEAVSHKVS